MSEAISGFGTKLKMGDGASPEVFSDIAAVSKVGGPGVSLDTIDVTADDSPGGYKEYAAGLLDAGEIKLELNFLPANASQTGLLTALTSRAAKNFKLVFPDTANTTWSFSAFVTNFEPDAPVDGKLAASVTLKITGQPTLA
ncbi:MAG: phage tail tube protein [Elusimicrobiales bacterium]